ncbi:MAG: glycine--tRNA ligase subunit beta [Maricaulaceae bacterium]
MAELLFEIFCEEIPARMQIRAGADLSKAITDGLKKAGLKVESVQTLTGPRRLVYVADVPLRSPDISEERKGPRVGSPEQALAGFMRGAGLTDISQAEIRSDKKKGDHYVAVIEKNGEDTADILSALIPDVLNNFPWPKSMKSGAESFRWVRPLQRMICLLGGDVVPVTAGGVTAANITEGHRRHGAGPFTVKNFADYKDTLEGEGHVILGADARKELILTDARKACAAKGLELVEDEGLLNEVAGLAEWPVVILGDMDPSFLELPGEVIRLSMRTHQKYFAVRDPKTGSLAPNFIVVANQAAPDGGKAIAEGNSRVLSARLGDAQFFQGEDAKKKLIDYYDKLDTVVFHKKLGSIKDKAERVAALAKTIAPKVGADANKAEQAAKLAKCDLVTQTVIEFTSLQGQIGRLMYGREGGDADIAEAIEDHYKPQGPSDAVPSNPVAVAVALADKLDTLVGFWAIEEKPTGSKDPYALRRAALGLVRIILENKIRIKILSLIKLLSPRTVFSIANNSDLKNDASDSSVLKVIFDIKSELSTKNKQNILELDLSDIVRSNKVDQHIVAFWGFDVFEFILDRLKVYLRDKNIRHDVIDAVLSNKKHFALIAKEDDLVSIVNRTEALQDFLTTDAGVNLLAGYKRAANILKAEGKKGALPEGAPSAPSNADAAKLFAALQSASGDIDAALGKESYSDAMTALSELRGPIDGFFENVMVVDEDAAVRGNNLKLLLQIRETAGRIADFEKVDG